MSRSRDERARRWPWVVGLSIPAVYLAGSGASALLSLVAPEDPLEDVLLLVGFGMFAVVGGGLVAKRPANPVGWMLAAIGLIVGLLPLGPSYAEWLIASGREPTTLQALLAWPNNWYWYLLLALTLIFLPLLFPDGRLPSRRWRAPAGLAALATVAICALGAAAESIHLQSGAQIPNPLGVRGVVHVEQHPAFPFLGIGAYAVGIVTAVAALAVRFRRSSARERAQVKWLLFGAALMPLLLVPEAVEAGGLEVPDLVGNLVFVVVLYALPTAIAVAVLRYRLYDIDRVVSRTVAYVLVTAVLLAVYGGVVLLLGRVAGQGSDFAVAVATLAAAAVFRPLRRGVQTVVDRRFDRVRYDARRTVAGFASRLRDEVRADQLTRELMAATSAALQPARASVWLRSRP